MKILQLTFTYGNNMGAMLQAYALNRVLTEMGNECELLPFFEHPFELNRDKSLRGKISQVLKQYKGRYYSDEWFSQFNHFLYQRCKFAGYTDLEQLSKLEQDYDLFLAGSDQVWNMQNYDSKYCLLQWVSAPQKRASYACSLGNYSIRLRNDPVSEAIRQFPVASFREKMDYEDAVRNGISSRIDVDPTFLLEKAQWEDLCDMSYMKFENRVVVFGYDKIAFNFAKEYCRKYNLEMVIVNYFGNRVFPGIQIVNPADPLGLLSIIKYAACVVTHSYHVFILSLNMNKRVFVSNLLDRKTKSTNRFDTVISRFGIKNIEATIENSDNKTNWEELNYALSIARNESKLYLRRLTNND